MLRRAVTVSAYVRVRSSVTNTAKRLFLTLILVLGGTLAAFAAPAGASPAAGVDADAQAGSQAVMETFRRKEIVEGEAVRISDRKKQIIMFAMGVTLLVFVLTTAGLGISMVVLAKDVFLAHMIFAGLSVTLAIAHAVVAIVWFFPF